MDSHPQHFTATCTVFAAEDGNTDLQRLATIKVGMTVTYLHPNMNPDIFEHGQPEFVAECRGRIVADLKKHLGAVISNGFGDTFTEIQGDVPF